MKTKSIILSVLVVATAIAGIYFANNAGTNLTDPTRSEVTEAPARIVEASVRLPIPAADTGFAAFYLAVEKGFFEKHGLKVTLQPGSPELTPVKTTSQKTDQFGLLGGPELLLSAKNKGAPVVGVALLGKDADLAGIVTLKNTGITKLEQLQGKKVGFFIGHISTDILHMLFRKEKISIEEIDTGFDYGQLITGRIDGEWAFRTTAGINLPAKGVEINFISAADYGVHHHGYTLIANEEYAKQNPDVVKRMVTAIIEATKYSSENPQEAIAATMNRDPNFKQAVGEAQVVLYNKAIKNHGRLGTFSKEDLEETAAQMKSAGLLPSAFDPLPTFDNQYAEAYYKN